MIIAKKFQYNMSNFIFLKGFFLKNISSLALIILVSLWIVLFDNIAFFKQLTAVYPISVEYAPFLLSQIFVLTLIFMLIFVLLGYKYTLKPILIFMLLLTSVQNYFMVTYNILVDKNMIENIIQTDSSEALDLVNITLVLYFIFLGLLPSWFVYRVSITYGSFKQLIWSKIKTVITILLLIWLMLFSFSKHYTSFFREHKVVRFYINPLDGFFCFATYLNEHFGNLNVPLETIGADAKQAKKSKRNILIFVVGEATRADHFALNGYSKQTNPLMSKEDIFNFSNVSSCGTTTAVSVPCMFSFYKKSSYNSSRGKHSENLLDILNRAGVEVLWRDNNSDSKGVAVRLDYTSYKSKEHNSVCDIECRDEGMLKGLEEKIKATNKDMIIVLHQMGNHGPAYYKRYPKEFEKFKPACHNNQLEHCTQEEIANAYDNALLYSDYFLSKVVALLKKEEDNTTQTAMLYVADHGESLGEGGLYLHGLPYFIAPDAQTKVPMVMWFSKNYEIDRDKFKKIEKKELSHDNIFSTLLGMFNVKTKVYNREDDIFKMGDL